MYVYNLYVLYYTKANTFHFYKTSPLPIRQELAALIEEKKWLYDMDAVGQAPRAVEQKVVKGGKSEMHISYRQPCTASSTFASIGQLTSPIIKKGLAVKAPNLQ